MEEIILFDWGNTLMVDLPESKGKMCDWEAVSEVDGAFSTLRHLSKSFNIYIATNAGDSTESDILKAFQRVNLDQFIDGYFCYDNLGVRKGTKVFFDKILNKLDVSPEKAAMVGDSLDKDILPASEAGIRTYWLSSETDQDLPDSTCLIRSLSELCA